MADVAQLLQGLRPMREPPAPSTVVPYLDMLAFGVVAAAVAFLVLRRARSLRSGIRRHAEAALALSRRHPPSERLAAQAQLLRRIVRTVAGDDAAGAVDAAWLATLDRTFATTFFTTGEGRVFGAALYRSGSDKDVEGIDRAVSTLVRNVRA